jgi:hypothetical protein
VLAESILSTWTALPKITATELIKGTNEHLASIEILPGNARKAVETDFKLDFPHVRIHPRSISLSQQLYFGHQDNREPGNC